MLKRFNNHLFDRGIFKGTSKYYVGLAHTQEDAKQTIEAYASAIDEIRG